MFVLAAGVSAADLDPTNASQNALLKQLLANSSAAAMAAALAKQNMTGAGEVIKVIKQFFFLF